MTPELQRIATVLDIIRQGTNPATLPERWASLFRPTPDQTEAPFTAGLRSLLHLPISTGFSDTTLHSIYESLAEIERTLDFDHGGLLRYLREAHSKEFLEDLLPLARTLLVNMRRLVASAAAACAWRSMPVGQTPNEMQDIEAAGFPMWFSQAALPGEEHAAINPPDWTRSFDELTIAHPGTALWVRWWLQDSDQWKWSAAGHGRSVEVPFACVDGSRGYICQLRLWRLPGTTPRLVQHPSCVLYAVTEEWLEPLRMLSSICAFPVCWEIVCENLPLTKRAFSGPSAGGAAARGFWHLDSDPIKVPDPGVLVLAQLDGAASRKSPWTTLRLKQVESLKAKKKAAWDDKSIDTVVEVNSAGDMVVQRRRGRAWALEAPETRSGMR